ncbi:MAG TPA: DNA gyrase subunit A, partial [Bacteroidia bacterium]|nr:DNA gyrase subunit A [Bacteroidia bacterium]
IEKTIEALYAFTDCEVSIAPNSCVIRDGKPEFLNVNDILKESTYNTLELLKRELEIELSELMEDWHFSSLEKIFIENRIYRKIEECETWEAVIQAIDKGLNPFKKLLKREVTEDDIVKLTEIKIKRISKFDAKKADEHIKALNDKIKVVKDNLKNLTPYAIAYFKDLLKKYGKGKERKTVISEEGFEQIEVRKVVINNAKLYVNREEGFAGYGLKKDELVSECSDIDDVLAITGDGKFVVNRISDKSYYGKDIRFIKVFEKNDENTVYNMVYRDGARGDLFIKRFSIGGITREKIYDLTKGTENSKIIYLGISGTDNAPTIQIVLKPRPKLKNTMFNVNFNEMLIKNRSAVGNILTKFPVHKITEVGKGKSEASAVKSSEPSKKNDKESEPELFEFPKEKSPAEQVKTPTQKVQMKMEI